MKSFCTFISCFLFFLVPMIVYLLALPLWLLFLTLWIAALPLLLTLLQHEFSRSWSRTDGSADFDANGWVSPDRAADADVDPFAPNHRQP